MSRDRGRGGVLPNQLVLTQSLPPCAPTIDRQIASPIPFVNIASGPFYGFNRPGVAASQPVILNWWRQGMMGAVNAHYLSIKALSETDFTEDLKMIEVPTLVLHGDDDQVVPIEDSAPHSAKFLKEATPKIYKGLPHGMAPTHPDIINPDLLRFITV